MRRRLSIQRDFAIVVDNGFEFIPETGTAVVSAIEIELLR